MKKLIHLIVLSCKKASLLIEKGHHQPLSFVDRIQLRMHLSICDKCTEYQKQSFLIENCMKNNIQEFLKSSGFKLSDTSKIRIQKAIEENLKNI